MRYLLTLIVGLGIGMGVFALWNRQGSSTGHEDGANGAESATSSEAAFLGASVVAVGRLVPANGVVSIVGPAEQQIVKILVDEGDSVDAGSPLVQLDSELADLELGVLHAEHKTAQIQAEAAVLAAKAQKEAAELQLQQAELENPQIDSQKQEINVLKANLAAAKNSLQKMREIPDLVPSQKIEQQAQLVRSTEAQLAAANNSLKQLNVAAEQAVLVARSKLKLAEADLVKAQNAYSKDAFETRIKKAESLRDRLTIRSPIEGTVLEIALHQGDTLGPRPIMEIANLNPMYCVAEVYESDRAAIQNGMTAKITSPAISGRQSAASSELTGTVVSVGQMISRTTLDNLDPFKPQDKHVFIVKIQLDEPSQRIAAQLINLQVEVEIRTDQEPKSTSTTSDGLQLGAL